MHGRQPLAEGRAKCLKAVSYTHLESMRTLISMTYVYSVNATCMSDDSEGFRFIDDLPDDDEEEKRIVEFLAGADLFIMGRVLYEDFASHFQGKTAADHPFAPIYAATNKVVFSQTLASADWERSAINRGDLVAEVKNCLLYTSRCV